MTGILGNYFQEWKIQVGESLLQSKATHQIYEKAIA
jgi:hypothetical protein